MASRKTTPATNKMIATPIKIPEKVNINYLISLFAYQQIKTNYH